MPGDPTGHPRPRHRPCEAIGAATGTRLVWLLAAVLAAALVLALVGGAVARWLAPKPEPILPDDTRSQPKPEDAQAAALRNQAFEACDAQRWGECSSLLDRAFHLQPAGEQDPRVQKARAAIDEAAKPPSNLK